MSTALVGCSFRSEGTGGATFTDDTSIEQPDDTFAYDDDASLDTFVPATDTGDTSASIDALPGDGSTPCGPSIGDLCKTIPPLTGSQILDGIGDEFCSETVFDVMSGQFTDPKTPPSYVSAVAHVRAAWSSFGMHFHIAVHDETFFPTPADRPHWQGDSVELFIAGSDTLTGAYDGVIDKGATQLVFVPGNGVVPQRAGIYFKGGSTAELPSSLWTTRVVAGGYEIEAGLSWEFLGALGAIAKGRKIGLDIAVNDVPDAARTQFFYSVMHIDKPVPAGSCGQPFCDDRVWCRATLTAK